MMKAKKYTWSDSNLALFGSDTDKAVKKESAECEKAWQDVISLGDTPGTLVWRIVKFKVESWPKEEYGKLFSGDSYIIFNQKPKPDNPDVLEMHIHFWIGKESTQDEYGTAAYKTVELDTLMDDKPIQHREVQGHESDLFKSYFDHLTIMKGGADTGFRHVTPVEYKPRLFKFCRVNRRVTVTEIKLSLEKINSDDVFILDNGLVLYQFNGNACSNDERFKAAQYLQTLADSRNGKPRKEPLDEDDLPKDHDFYRILDEGDDAEDDDDDDETDGASFSRSLFKLSDASGSLDFNQIKTGSITLADFQPQDVFIYDTGLQLFVWVGNAASQSEKRNALGYAHKYLQSTGHPLVPVTVVKDGQESEEFHSALK